MKKGMTLVEILVSLTMLAFILAAIFTILNLQTVRSVQVQKTTILQTDAQVALTLLKWDLGAAGLGYPMQDDAVQSQDNVGANGSDAITMRAVGLGFESANIKWSWLLERSSTDALKLRKYDKDELNFVPGEWLVVLDVNRKIMNPPGNIQVLDTASFVFIDQWGDSIPGQLVTVDLPVGAIAGLVVICKYGSIYTPGITLSLNANNQLIRGNDVLLENVEDLQFAYGIDSDGDGVIESWFNNVPQFATAGQKWAIRYSMVVTSRTMGGYEYPLNTINLENNPYALSTTDRMRKRAILTGIIAPANLQP
ncbi:MAG: prepilin-type N-terminal cleavage/methylation domain-containing protein [bacterium]